jgi:hypothetical protein
MIFIYTNGKCVDLHEKNDDIFKRLWNKPAIQIIKSSLPNNIAEGAQGSNLLLG